MAERGWRLLQSGEYIVADLPELEPKAAALVDAAVTRLAEGGQSSPARMRETLRSACLAAGTLPTKAEFAGLLAAAERSVSGFGVLDCLLADPELEEIAVTGIGQPVRVYHRTRGWLTTNIEFTQEGALVNLINKMARALGRRITLQQPKLNAVLPDGSRLHAAIPPVAFSGPELTIRKFRQQPFSPADLISLNAFTAEAAALLWFAAQSDCSILIVGNTSSGKTSLLNSLFSFVPLGDRVVITEETPEINIPHKHQVRMVANRELAIDMRDIVADTLRMRPDRVIVGEVRTRPELEALFETILAGQARGCYATFHGLSAKEALVRAASAGIPAIDLQSLDLVIAVRRWMQYAGGMGTEKRRVMEIAEVSKTEWDGQLPKLVPLFAYDHETDRLERVPQKQSALTERLRLAFSMSKSQFEKELGKRADLLNELVLLKPPFSAAVERIQAFL